ncbi:MAG: hypothetical protein M3O09_00010 [Acidobacteriota bacterium]|nr:hypothetical protein [Acidobacteriota bacterium]
MSQMKRHFILKIAVICYAVLLTGQWYPASLAAAKQGKESGTADVNKVTPKKESAAWEFYVFIVGVVGIVGGAGLLWYADRWRSNKIEAMARSLGFTFRREATERDNELITGCSLDKREKMTRGKTLAAIGETIVFGNDFLYRQTISNVVEAARTEELNMTVFDQAYRVGNKGNQYYNTISRIQSPMLKLPWFKLSPGARSSDDMDFPEAPEFNRKYVLTTADEEIIRAIFTPALIQYLVEQPAPLTVGADGDLMFVYRYRRRTKARDFATSIERHKRIFSLLLEGQRSQPSAEETAD